MPKKPVRRKKPNNVEKLRDELSGEARTFKSEMRQEWHKIERDWQRLQSQMLSMKRAAGKSASDVRVASVALLDQVRKSYQQMKRHMRSQSPRTRAAVSPRRSAA